MGTIIQFPTRPRSGMKCGCGPVWHAINKQCQRDIAHVYGDENPLVAWLRSNNPDALNERACTALAVWCDEVANDAQQGS